MYGVRKLQPKIVLLRRMVEFRVDFELVLLDRLDEFTI